MRNVLIEKPYEFVRRFKPSWPQRWLVQSGLLEWTLRKREGVVAHEIRHLHRLEKSLGAGHGILLIANHPRSADPMVLQFVSRALRCPFYTMASRHVFEQNWLNRSVARWMGGFSVNREGLDRQSIDEAIEILQFAERPLVIFPEGTTSRTNDQLMALMDGPAFIARTAQKRRAKNDSGKVVCHPMAIKHVFEGDIEPVADAVLSDIERELTWRPHRELPLLARLVNVGNGLLTLKELEYGVNTDRLASLRDRQTHMVNHLLIPLETEWLGAPQNENGIAVRIKNLSMQIFPEMSRAQVDPLERDRRWKQLQDMNLAQQIDCYPDRYVAEFPSVDRILETIEKFEEHLTGKARIHGQLKSIIEIDDPIEVPLKRQRGANQDPLMVQIKDRISVMLGQLQYESRIYQAADTTQPKPTSNALVTPAPQQPDAASESTIPMSPNPGNGKLFNRGFASLVGAAFLGAANDNILKQILILMVVAGGLWAHQLGAGTQGVISLVLTVPFIFLSGYAGQIADKFSKRQVILCVKLAEIPIAAIALLGLLLGNFWLALFALFLLAVQSSFFGPAKFGVIPDLVDSHRLSQANGLINAVSNVAVILGALAAGPLTDLYFPTVSSHELDASLTLHDAADTSGNLNGLELANPIDASEAATLLADPTRHPQRWPAGMALLLVAASGLVTVLLMPKMRPVDPKLKLSGDFFGPHIQTFKDANRPLLVVMFSWSGFYLIGALALLLLPEYKSILGLNNTEITNLTGVLAVAIMIGSCTVGFLSGQSIRPYFALFGAIGMTVSFFLMGVLTPDYYALAGLLFLAGFCAGFYIVPLQSLLQFLSPTDERGRFFGTANALSFVCVSAAGLLYIVLAQLGLPPARIPLVCSLLAMIGTLVGMAELNRIMAAQKRTRIALDQA